MIGRADRSPPREADAEATLIPPVARIPLEPVWSLGTAAPALLRVISHVPWVAEEYRTLEREALIATTVAPFSEAGYTRPIGHLRSFYLERDGARVAYKGTELHAADFSDALRALSQFRSCDPHPPHLTTSLLSLADRFAVMEHKAPGVALLTEVMAEATAATELQLAHLARHGELARLPVPLHVHRWSDDAAAAYLAAVLPTVTARSAPIIERLISGGLGTIAYYYPGAAPRVNAIGFEHPELYRELTHRISLPDRLAVLEAGYPLRETIASWLQLVSRMLALGFFPNDPYGNYLLGECIQWQNAVLDGGFVDVDSITAMRTIPGERAFTETFVAMIVELATTLRKLLLGPVQHANLEYKDPSLATALLVMAVWDGIRRGVELERAAGGLADARLEQLVSEGDTYAFVRRCLTAMHPRPDAGEGPGLVHMTAFL